MRVLVLGGTGAIGAHLVELLHLREHEVAVTSRSKEGRDGTVRYLRGNPHDERFLQSVLTRQRWSAIVDFMVYSSPAFERRIGSLLAATDQYVFLSTARVYANCEHPLTEDSPRLLDVCTDQKYLETDEYALAKARQEDILISTERPNWTIIRPYITFSHSRLQLGVLEKEDWLFRALHGRTVVFSRDMNSRLTTLTHGADVARGIFSILGERRALREAFHVANAKPVLWSDALTAYLQTIAARGSIPPPVLLADLDSFALAHPAQYQVNYDRLYHRVFDSRKIATFVDTTQFAEPIQTLTECLRIFLIQPRFRPIDGRNEARKDRLTGQRTPLAQIPGIRQKARYITSRYFDIPAKERL